GRDGCKRTRRALRVRAHPAPPSRCERTCSPAVTPGGDAAPDIPLRVAWRRVIPGLDNARTAGEPLAVELRSVLVVDEALPIRRKLIDILQRAGVGATDVHEARSAREALELFARARPTVVLCELVEDASRGLEMVLEMLMLDPRARVVLVTAEDPDSPVVRAAIRAGAFGVVRKPLRHEAIRQVLAEIEAEEGGIERYR
ncbi:MAG TPA: response regulator, partial [Candidatus Thermoplasmatota archaeon]|nr:response regulator [Candidatus Thermoplasmatota archaeon]